MGSVITSLGSFSICSGVNDNTCWINAFWLSGNSLIAAALNPMPGICCCCCCGGGTGILTGGGVVPYVLWLLANIFYKH